MDMVSVTCLASLGLPQFGLVWFGLALFDLIWSGLVWSGMVWPGFGLVCVEILLLLNQEVELVDEELEEEEVEARDTFTSSELGKK